MKTLSLLSFSVIAFAAFADSPFVDWAQYPVKAGNNVLLHGGNWGEDAKVEIGGQMVNPVNVTKSGLVFPYPFSAEKIVKGRIVSKSGKSNSFVLNAPDVWWLQGDGGDISTPGGWLRAFGRSLAGGAMRIRKEGGKWFEVKLWRVDDYELAAEIPADFKCGKYEVQVKNGLGNWKSAVNAGVWNIQKPRKIWKDDVFDITSFGAVADDGVDDSDSLRAALLAAAKNGGGKVLIPRGIFNVQGTFDIPPATLLCGIKKNLSHLKWPDVLNPPEFMLVGEHSFGIHDLFISVGQYRNGIGYKGGISKSFWAANEPKTHDISLKNLTLRFVTDQQRDRDKKVFLERFTMKGMPICLPDALRVEMVNVDLYCDKCPTDSKYFTLTGWYHRIANCSFRGGAWAAAPGINFIFEDNVIEKGCISINPMCNGAYFARNKFSDVYRGDPICLGHDSSRTAFGRCQKPVRARLTDDPRKLKIFFEDPSDNPNNKPKTAITAIRNSAKSWFGTDCTIVAGHGVGQSRKIKSISDDWGELVLEEPFGVQPDETSFIYVSTERRHVLMIDNEFHDAGRGVELYGGANEYIIARNKSYRAGGMKAQGFAYSGIIPCWRVQYLDNVIEEGSGERSESDILACGEYSLSFVARGNVLKSGSTINFLCADGLIEGNDIRNSNVGIAARSGTYIGSNAFYNVVLPLSHSPDAVLSPEAQESHESWKRDLIKKLKDATSQEMTAAEFRRLFDARISFSINRKTIQDILKGQTWPKGLSLPISMSLNPLIPAIKSIEISAEGLGGWSYGKSAMMALQSPPKGRKAMNFYGVIKAFPSGEKTGYFTIPLTILVEGVDGWKVKTLINTPIASTGYENFVTQWRWAKVKGSELPKDLKSLKWTKVDRYAADGGVDCTWMDCAKEPEFFGNYTDSLVFESRFEVKKPVCIGFCRNDIPGVFSLDGEIIHRAGAWYNVYVTRVLKPGVYVIRNFRPRGGWMMRYRAKSLRVFFSHPKGANPGDYVFLPAEEDFSSFKKVTHVQSAPLNALDNPEFEDRSSFGKVDRHLEIGPTYGYNGTAGGRLWAWQRVRYQPFTTKFRLEVGKKYRFSYFSKSHAWGATTVEWELLRDGKKIDAALGPTSEDVGDGWVKRELVIAPRTPQKEGDESRILIIATQRGRESVSDQKENYIDIDNFVLREDIPDWYLAHSWPTRNRVYNDIGNVRFCSFFKGSFIPTDAEPVYEARLADDKGRIIASRRLEGVREGSMTAEFGKLSYKGPAVFSVTLYDKKNKINAGTRDIPVKVLSSSEVRNHGIFIEENGVSWLDGKRFMPLGFYGKFANKELYPDLDSELKRFSEMGFNCVIDYCTERLKTKEERDEYYGLMDKYGIKVFPVDFMGDGCANEQQWKERMSVVENRAKELAKYPSVIGWYTMDEAGEDKIPQLERTRRSLNEATPGKVTLPCNILDPEPFASIGDVQSGDRYPVGRSPNLLDMHRYVSRCEACKPAAAWHAPQMYNWVTQNKASHTNEVIWRANGREPKENEVLSVALEYAVHGVNGFFFYSWFDIVRCPIKEVINERWRIAGSIAKQMRELEPYITSGKGIEHLSHRDIKGSHHVSAFTDTKGRKAVVIIGLDSDNEVEFELPKGFGNLKSKCGKARKVGNKWFFKGSEFTCDILM